MTSPPREITVHCPLCGHLYQDWHRASLNLLLEHFDEEYIKQASSSTCPECQFTVSHGALIVRDDGVWEIGAGDSGEV